MVKIMPVEIVCKMCGNHFFCKPSKVDRTKFCSKKCQYKWMSINRRGKNHPSWRGGVVTKTCTVCNKEYQVTKSWAEKVKFCSRKCMGVWESINYTGNNHPNWKGGREDYCREYIYHRDNYVCQLCGSNEVLNTHHIYPKKKYPELAYHMDNIITLCNNCHNFFRKHEESFIDFFERIRGDINE